MDIVGVVIYLLGDLGLVLLGLFLLLQYYYPSIWWRGDKKKEVSRGVV